MTEHERREFLKAALAAMGGMAATGATSCRWPGAMCYSPARPPGVTSEEFTEIRNPTCDELVGRLEQLAKSKPPKNLVHAMCYSTVPDIKEEKPCSECTRTMEVGERDKILREYNVPLKRIQDQEVDAALIIPEHCPECGFGLKEAKFQLEIKYPDLPAPVRVELESHRDIELMALFLTGKDRYTERKGGDGQDVPLKDKVGRLQELFGVREKQ